MAEQEDIIDPLLSCLKIVCELEQHSFSEKAATSGLPLVESKLTPELFIRAAERLGFKSKLYKRDIGDISNLMLPAVLVLKNNNACVIKKFKPDGSVIVFFPESGSGIHEVKQDELADQYEGYAIFISPEMEYDKRSLEYHSLKPSSWYWDALLSFKNVYGHIAIATFLTNLAVLIIPLFIMNVYDRVVPTNATTTLWVLAIAAVVFLLFDLTSRIIRTYLMETVAKRSDKIISARMFAQLLSLKLEYRPASAGSVANYFNEFAILRDFFTSAAFVGLIDLPFIIIFLAFIWILGGNLVLIPLISIPVILIAAYLGELPAKKNIEKNLAGQNQKQAILVEMITGLEAIKSLNAEGIIQKKYERSSISAADATTRSKIITMIILNCSVWIQQVAVIAVVVYGVFLINAGLLSIGGLIAVTILTGRALMLGQVASLLTRFDRTRNALKGLNNIMSLPNERSAEHKYIRRPRLTGEIKVQNVSYYYPGERITAIDNVSFALKPGERVGIVGRIGSGKSTLLKLIVGLYTPSSGSIVLDDCDTREIDPSDLRHNAHYVGSNSMLFYGSVKDNILLANIGASDDEVIKAAKIAGLDKIIGNHPKGYDMQVGERGELLSSGQRQAIALARSFLSDPPIMLFDEPTASMDSQFESEIKPPLNEFIDGRTLLLVSHRISMLDLVDRVVVLDAGKIIADGPRKVILDALVNKKLQ